MLGKEYSSTLTSINNLVEVLSSQGKYEETQEINRQILTLMKTVLGKKYPYTLTSINNLVSVLSSQGKYKETEEMHR